MMAYAATPPLCHYLFRLFSDYALPMLLPLFSPIIFAITLFLTPPLLFHISPLLSLRLFRFSLFR
jgi:hypothetical protein